MKLVALTALALFACSTASAPDTSDPTTVGSSEEELRKLAQLGAEDVGNCRAIADRCSQLSDSGASLACDRIADHCEELETQLAEDRAELEQCLQAAAACEQDPNAAADCDAARAACGPRGDEFRERRDRTLQCSSRAAQCLERRGGMIRGGASDAGADVCEDGADDFVGCCHGNRDFGGDAGAGGDRLGVLGRRSKPDVDAGSGFGPGADDDRPEPPGLPLPRRRP